MYNFDEAFDRRGSHSLKWDTPGEGVIPLWVADMDFPCLPELRDALIRRASHPFYGYKSPDPDYYEAIQGWYRDQYSLELDRAAILTGPGTVLSLGMIVREFTAEADGVLLMTPVYTPFFEVVKQNRRRVVNVPLRPDRQGRFILDIDDLERGAARAEAEGIRVPLALFCSPHNPGGRVWTREEITAFFEFAGRRRMIAAADEIHGDFVYPRNGADRSQRFVSAASIPEIQDRVIVVSGANKAFNLGGIHISHFVIQDGGLRKVMKTALHRENHHQGDVFAEEAVKTVYRHGGAWIEELRAYLAENIRQTAAFLEPVSGIRVFVPDGTYLIWADAKALAERTGCRDDTELAERLESEAKVKITPGSIYGPAGAGYVRINIACPRPLLMEALGRIKDWAGQAQR